MYTLLITNAAKEVSPTLRHPKCALGLVSVVADTGKYLGQGFVIIFINSSRVFHPFTDLKLELLSINFQ
jgi:hypothetical protein